MREGKLSGFIKSGYPHVKENTGMPPWVLPEYGFNRVVDEVGERGILKLAGPLGLADGMEPLLATAPDPAGVSAIQWDEAVKKWKSIPEVREVVAAFLEIRRSVNASLEHLQPAIDPAVICRCLSVLLLASFVRQGEPLLAEMAEILGQARSPAEIIRRYGEAVQRQDIAALDRVNQCISRYGNWAKCAAAMRETALGCRYGPKLVAVTPPASASLIGVLASMVKEANDGPSRDSSEDSSEPLSTR
ncbi:MAG: hypothetical protein HYX85_02850 [Chloroflexi bacterium]|nr:hypothetical protein [Chloroflexota bacterium]